MAKNISPRQHKDMQTQAYPHTPSSPAPPVSAKAATSGAMDRDPRNCLSSIFLTSPAFTSASPIRTNAMMESLLTAEHRHG